MSSEPDTTGANQPGIDMIYGVMRQELLRFLISRTGDHSEAEDILQELWMKLQASSGRPIGEPRSYLFRAVLNAVIDRRRRRQRRTRRELLWFEAQYGAEEDPADPCADAEQAIIDEHEERRLKEAIAALPKGARRAFELHRLQGLSHAEVASILGISRGGVEKHMSLALKHLRRAMAD
jgi:RNA polymerase sigma-70 factor (ECF subfamily)